LLQTAQREKGEVALAKVELQKERTAFHAERDRLRTLQAEVDQMHGKAQADLKAAEKARMDAEKYRSAIERLVEEFKAAVSK